MPMKYVFADTVAIVSLLHPIRKDEVDVYCLRMPFFM